MVKFLRQRYVLFEILQDGNIEISRDSLMKRIWREFLHLYGTSLGYRAGLWLIRYNPKTGHGILRCDNVTRDELITCLAFIRHIENINVLFHTRKTSGTVKNTLKLWRKFLISPIPPRE